MKNRKDYVYSSTELSRYYGLTVKGMEFYERKNLIHPERIGKGKMRRIDLKNCYRLATVRMLQNCGFSLNDSAELLERNTPEYLAERMAGRAEKLAADLEVQKGILEHIREKERLIRLVGDGGCRPVLVQTEPAVRLFVRLFNDEHESTDEETQEFAFWNTLMPITEASLCFPLRDILSEKPDLETEIGMIMTEKEMDRLGVKRSGRVQPIAGGLAVYGICAFEETVLDRKEPLKECLDFIRENGLQCCADGYSRLIHVMKNDRGESIRYDEVWFPVRPIP
ncbi:MAG: MerR family transcriptional regulator [Clostridiales bacterium]|nr:MerR family transcriptional regulator [Clostridiales bacterium]